MSKNHTNSFKGWYKVCRLWSGRLFIILLPVILFSCTTQKNLTYLHDIDASGKESFSKIEQPEYRLQKQDILYVKIITQNEDINTSLNWGASSSNQNIFESERGIYINGFSINDSGFIKLPVIGNVQVLDKTIEEATHEIEYVSSIYLKEVSVIVKLLSFKVTLLGEVNDPGTYSVNKSQITVFEAIGLASDITDFGDRSKILIVRATENGPETMWLDLQKKDILGSEDYLLHPNDIVIVNPIKAKFLDLNSPTISFFLSTIVSTISITLLIMSLR